MGLVLCVRILLDHTHVSVILVSSGVTRVSVVKVPDNKLYSLGQGLSVQVSTFNLAQHYGQTLDTGYTMYLIALD